MGMLVGGTWTEDDGERHRKGAFVRNTSPFRNWITEDGGAGPTGDGGFKAEAGRYHLYLAHNCPWAYRTYLFRRLKGLEDIISISIAATGRGEQGWKFVAEPGCIPDAVNGVTHLHEVYTKADADFTGRITVPTLWDAKQQTIVNNESSEIIRMFNSAFAGLAGAAPDFYPEALRGEIDAINDRVYENVNNGVYRCGFAKSQDSYEEAYDKLFAALDDLEERLGGQRYLVGERLTEADWRLFATLIRFDLVYYSLFKCNKRHIYEYPNLWNFTLELYQYPGVAEISMLDHFKRGYYSSAARNPAGTIPKGPELDFNQPHDRGRLPAAAA